MRHYQLTVPDDYDGTKPLPVVFGLHTLTVSYLFVSSMVGFADMEKRDDFIGVAPSGRLNGTTPYWLAAPVARQLRPALHRAPCSTISRP